MRLVLCDVELVQTEREVDRVEVFERRGWKRQMEREKRDGEDECRTE